MKKQEIQKIVDSQRAWLYKERSLNKKFRIKALKRLYSAIIKYRAEIHLALARDLGLRNEEFCFDETQEALSIIREDVLKLRINPFLSTPKGVVLIMTPWFSPFITVMKYVIDEIANGNTVIIKPSSYAENTAKILDKMFSKAFPDCFVKVITGNRNTNKSLTNVQFDKVDFCGNKEVAKSIFTKALDTNTPFEIDVCDVNSYIVKSDDKLIKEAYYLADNKFSACGQTKDAIDIIIVEDSVIDSFTGLFIEATEAFVDSDPLVSDDYGKIKDENSYKRLNALIEKYSDGIIYGGAKSEKTNQIGPVIIRTEFDKIVDMKEKVLGPVMFMTALSKKKISELERDRFVGEN